MVISKKRRGHSLLELALIHKKSCVMVTLLLLVTSTSAASKHYYMNNQLDCSMQGFIEIATNEQAIVTLRSNGAKEFDTQRCDLRFQAASTREFIKVQFQKFFIGSCTVKVLVNQYSYTCGQAKPSTKLLDNRQVTLSVIRDLNDNQYDADIIVSTYSKDYKDDFQDDVSNPTLIGIIVGVVCGIIVIILIIAIAGHCYYKKIRANNSENFDGALHDSEQSSIGVCYINEGVKNGGIIKNSNSPKNNDRSLLSPDEEVKQFYDYIEENKQHAKPNINILVNNSKTSEEFDNNDLDKKGPINSNPTPKSPVLDALHGSPKFQASFKFTEAEAEERAKRISQGSTLPPTPPPLPTVPSSPQMHRSQINTTNHAGIRRVPKISASSEDMEHLEKEMNVMEAENQNVSKLPSNTNSTLSSRKVVPTPITTNIPPQSVEQTPSTVSLSSKDNSSNQHTLRPARLQDKKKQGDIMDGQPIPPRPPKASKEKDGTNSLRKRGHKVPKFSKGKSFPSETDSNFTYGNDPARRPDTPLSEVSSRMARTDDNESLPPLQRSTSRQSLFASRTSLYGRRGKRERRSSISDSVTSYAHDDLDMYMPSVQQDPMDRRDARVFKSLGDITKTSKDGSYQDQTKKTASKKHASKKPASSRKSSSSTQTIEQKGTQTEASRKKASTNSDSLPREKPASNIKDDGITAAEPQIETSKSQFQPISKASDALIGNQYQDNRPLPLEGVESTKPTKSPWELLCELTDAEMKMQDTSSVPFGNALYDSDLPPGAGGQSRPGMDNLPSAYHPSISSQVSDKDSFAPDTATLSYPPSAAPNPANNLYPRKSSWEALKELTDTQLSYPSQGHSESIV